MKMYEVEDNKKVPLELLLLADPSEEQIKCYVEEGTCYVAEEEDEIIGIYILYQTEWDKVEIVNIAVKESNQGKGIGKQLVLHAVDEARRLGYSKIDICTGNSSIGPLALYQKCGFRLDSIEKDYFIQHYAEPIYENGIQCRDKIRLRLVL
ncbi:GNAT family N-acetyltransferase [Radiobacillus deserti]|uniref:GNAT family N-acetyltransferase n=1 Tax=Radiobacillus deserti TaxID=2594883 RepID=A0A516KK95_9BACI|nr:GNAT family N-acetyltransferase [Radiobacillus deserti]QDP41796.1 GNAT family N-acetyltransferase [Radiobacillus deserti]